MSLLVHTDSQHLRINEERNADIRKEALGEILSGTDAPAEKIQCQLHTMIVSIHLVKSLYLTRRALFHS